MTDIKKSIWIYLEEKRKFQELAEDDPRLDWSAAGYAPTRRVRFRMTKAAKYWHYAPYGSTKEDCADAANLYVNADILKLERNLAELRARLVLP